MKNWQAEEFLRGNIVHRCHLSKTGVGVEKLISGNFNNEVRW